MDWRKPRCTQDILFLGRDLPNTKYDCSLIGHDVWCEQISVLQAGVGRLTKNHCSERDQVKWTRVGTSTFESLWYALRKKRRARDFGTWDAANSQGTSATVAREFAKHRPTSINIELQEKWHNSPTVIGRCLLILRNDDGTSFWASRNWLLRTYQRLKV